MSRLRMGLWVAIAAAAVAVVVALSAGHSTAARTTSGRTIDGIACEASEQVLFHIHAHLAIFVDGRPAVVPAGIGIPRGDCLYWLHSHTSDGVIHIESPVRRTYTLGEYFDIWGQPLGGDRVGPARGAVTAYVDGRSFAGDPRSIALNAHARVQLDVGRRVAPQPFDFPAGL